MQENEIVKYEAGLIKRVGNAIKITSKLLDLSTSNDAFTYYKKGIEKSKLKNYVAAIDDYSKAIEINPEYSYAFTNRAVAKFNLNLFSGALSDYSKAIDLDPTYNYLHFLYYCRGRVKHELKNYLEAIEDYTKAIKICPRYASAYNDRGNSKSKLGNYLEAIEDYTKGIEIDPIFYKGIIYFNRGKDKQKIHDNSAREDFQKAHDLGCIEADDVLRKYYS